MKTKVGLTILIVVLLVLASQAQERKNYILSFEGKNKTHTLGFYGGLNGLYSTVNENGATWFGGKAGLVFDQHWAVGIAGSALNYDKNLDQLVSDGTYRLNAGYSGLFVEYLLPVKEFAKLSLSWTTGMGMAQYVYNNEFTAEKLWYEEIIDRDNFAANEFAAGVIFRITGNWWLGLEGSYRDTSPVELIGTDSDLFEKFNLGLSVKYGIF